MAISINSKSSGFRKWADAHQPTKIDKSPATADEDGFMPAPDIGQGGDTSNLQRHSPWLVAGAGKL